MKRKGLIILGSLVVLLAVGTGLGVWFGPQLVEDEIEKRLREQITRRGIEADWQSFDAGGGRSFVLESVVARDAKRGLDVEVERLIVDVALDAIMAGEVSIAEVSLEGVEAKVDLELLLNGEEGAATPSSQANTEQSKANELIQRILADPPDFRMERVHLEVLRDDDPLFEVTTDEAVLKERWGDFEFEFEGKAKITKERFPEALRIESGWLMAGKIAPDERTFEFELRTPQPGGRLLDLTSEQLGTIRLGRVHGRGNLEERSVEVQADEFAVLVGEGEFPPLRFEAPKIVAKLGANHRTSLRLDHPSAFVTPKKRDELGGIRETLSELVATTRPEKPGTGRGRRGKIAVASRLAARVDLDLAGLVVGVNLETEEGGFHPITVLERLDVHAHNGHVAATGATAGGKFLAEAEVVPGAAWPHYLVARAEGIRLEKLPGMKAKRTALPSRGTSGTLGGELNFDLSMVLPDRGQAGPTMQPAGYGELRASWTDGLIDLEGVADVPVEGVSTGLVASFDVQPEIGHATLKSAHAKYGPVVVDMTGEVRDFPFDTTLYVEGVVREIECQDAVRAIPEALLGPYSKIELEGTIAPEFWIKLPLKNPLGMRMDLDEYEDKCEILALNGHKDSWPEIKVVTNPPTGPHKSAAAIPKDRAPRKHDDVYWLNRGFVKRVTEGLSSEEVEVYVGPGTAEYWPLEKLPGYVGGAAYLSEQIDFYVDGPISLSLIKKALRLNMDKGRFVYGGSTVTQQLVKNLFLSRDKTLARKIQEGLISWRIDQIVTKDRVLELYLNCIEFGPDVYGIGPAARYYFQKEANQLTPKEAIFLAMLKPQPWYGEKVIQRRKTPTAGWWSERMALLFDRLVEHKFITQAELEAEKPFVLEWEKSGKYKRKELMFVPLLE